ncbi:ectoine synthase [Streptomyces sp. NPDC047071]|uniref:ectoine synthase n=1 Tax=Streptomyces sp. NPDC047071 TaxID=3154808 RepID=UPI00345612E3
MQVRRISEIEGTDRDVTAASGAWRSKRILLASDGFGYSVSETVVYAGTETDICYANHVEAVYCISGKMILVDRDENEEHIITPGTLHVLDDADNHTIKPIEDSTFLCIFTPALTGREDHDENGVYPLLTDEVVGAK